MISAVINGSLGVLLSFWVGTQFVNLQPNQILQCLAISWAATFVLLLGILAGERTKWIKSYILVNTSATWAVLCTCYFGSLLLLAPFLRNPAVFFRMIIPILLSTAFSIIAFGPIQDRIVANIQRRARGH